MEMESSHLDVLIDAMKNIVSIVDEEEPDKAWKITKMYAVAIEALAIIGVTNVR